MTARADCNDTSCSPERPPNNTPTRSRLSAILEKNTLEFGYLPAKRI